MTDVVIDSGDSVTVSVECYLGACPEQPTPTPSSTSIPPTPTPTSNCVSCERWTNNTFGIIEVDYQTCEGVWLYNELIQGDSNSICVVPGTLTIISGGILDLENSNCGTYCDGQY